MKKSTKIFLILVLLLLIMIFVLIKILPIIYLSTDCNLTLSDSNEKIKMIEKEGIVKILENDEKIIYLASKTDYMEQVSNIVKKYGDFDFKKQEGSQIIFCHHDTKKELVIEWIYTSFYHKFILYQ